MQWRQPALGFRVCLKIAAEPDPASRQLQEEVGGVAPVGLFTNTEWRRFREVAMQQIYLTITVSSLTLLVGVYLLAVVLL